MYRQLLKLLFLILVTQNILAQKDYPKDYFMPPLDIPLNLSGTFGELRSGHFHSGMDIRTGEVEGLNVFAIADGYISRIKITPGGYGKALYITHTNGYVSVYAHLQKYNSRINQYVKKEQFKRESYSIDIYPEKDFITVKKGEVVAISGNSGRSGGPHLHFEIRDEATQMPINPLLFGFEVEDYINPIINYLKVYPVNSSSGINQKNKTTGYYSMKKGDKYTIQNNDTLKISGKVYFGINTYDPFNNGNNKNGVYSIKLLMDSVLLYEHDLETFSFAETRYINSFIDFKEYKVNKRRVQKSFIQPNNHLSIYNLATSQGIIEFNDNDIHNITYEVADIAGNISYLVFKVKSVNEFDILEVYKNNSETGKQLFDFNSANVFSTHDLHFEVPGKALYDTLYFNYEVLPALNNSYSKVHCLHYDFVPLHSRCNLSVKPDSIPLKLHDKALIVKIEKDKKFASAGGKWENGFVVTRIREFGDYCVLVDTIAPDIKAINVYTNKNISGQNTIKIKITDELAGIKSYRGTLNDKWILMEYDEKKDILIYRFDEYLKKGENDFRLIVSDEKNNESTYTAKLFY